MTFIAAAEKDIPAIRELLSQTRARAKALRDFEVSRQQRGAQLSSLWDFDPKTELLRPQGTQSGGVVSEQGESLDWAPWTRGSTVQNTRLGTSKWLKSSRNDIRLIDKLHTSLFYMQPSHWSGISILQLRSLFLDNYLTNSDYWRLRKIVYTITIFDTCLLAIRISLSLSMTRCYSRGSVRKCDKQPY